MIKCDRVRSSVIEWKMCVDTFDNQVVSVDHDLSVKAAFGFNNCSLRTECERFWIRPVRTIREKKTASSDCSISTAVDTIHMCLSYFSVVFVLHDRYDLPFVVRYFPGYFLLA